MSGLCGTVMEGERCQCLGGEKALGKVRGQRREGGSISSALCLTRG